jgi:hypothetical protein
MASIALRTLVALGCLATVVRGIGGCSSTQEPTPPGTSTAPLNAAASADLGPYFCACLASAGQAGITVGQDLCVTTAGFTTTFREKCPPGYTGTSLNNATAADAADLQGQPCSGTKANDTTSPPPVYQGTFNCTKV